jgi:hypothetical protein
LRTIVERDPAYGMLFFNLACCESLTGRTGEALDALRRAVELSDEFRSLARGDPDLAAIRSDPAFVDLIGDG